MRGTFEAVGTYSRATHALDIIEPLLYQGTLETQTQKIVRLTFKNNRGLWDELEGGRKGFEDLA